MFGKLFSRCDSSLSFRWIIKKRFKSSRTILIPTCSSGVTQLSKQPPVHSPIRNEYSTPTHEDDLFSAQLRACRNQTWWTHNGHNDSQMPLDEVDASDDNQNHSESRKRSLSIRDIRERMNSDQTSIESSGSGELEFEPGLKFLHGIRGGWRDMEMFIG
jgi:hypothetical protein